MYNTAIYYMASWTVMLSHCWPLVFSQVLKGSSWIVGITAENWKIILPICLRHTCNGMSYTIMFKYDEYSFCTYCEGHISVYEQGEKH